MKLLYSKDLSGNRISFGLLKPDAVHRMMKNTIFRKIEDAGLKVFPFGQQFLNQDDIACLYPNAIGRTYWEDYVGYMSCQPVVPFLVYGNEAIRIMNEITGSMKKENAERESIRYLSIHDYFPEFDCIQNLIHSSFDEEALKREIRWLNETQRNR